MKKLLKQGSSRKIFVCLSNGCTKCSVNTLKVPKDCPYRILHVLEMKLGGIQEMPRQSGKTFTLINMANEIAKAGYTTYMVSMNALSAQHTRDKLDQRVIQTSQHQAIHRLSGAMPGYVLFDEVLPEKVREIMRYMGNGVLVAAYYTSR